jgi:nucleoside-diphosphate-sugar epimerase
MSEKVVVIGSTGFVGQAIMKELKATNIESVGFSRKDCDLLKQDEVLQKISPELKNATVVYTAGKHRQYGDTLDFYANNSAAVMNVLYAAEKNLPKRIVFLSTIEIYGSPKKNETITESTNFSPTYLYAAGKISHECLIRAWAHKHNVSCTMLRLPGIYGIGDNQTSIISTLFSAGMNDTVFNLHTDGSELRDYILVEDLVSCIIKIISTKNVPEVLNMGSGISISINHIIEQVGHVLGKSIKVQPRNPSLPGFDIVIDNSLLRSTLNDLTFNSVEQGIKLYADSLEKV